MRQHIYPGASLVVVDVVGTVASDVGTGGNALLHATMRQADAARIAGPHGQRRCDPVVITHRFHSTVRIDLVRDGNCYGWIELTVRAVKDAPLEGGVTFDSGQCSFSHTRVDLDREPQFRLRYLMPQAQKLSKVGARFAKAEALDVTPNEETRLLLRSGGQRRAMTVCSSVGQPLLQLGVSASSTFGQPARDLSALLGVRATSINVYDFGAPPSTRVGVRVSRGAQPQHAESASR